MLYTQGLFVVPTLLPYAANRYAKRVKPHRAGQYGLTDKDLLDIWNSLPDVSNTLPNASDSRQRPRTWELKSERLARVGANKPETDDPYKAAKGDWRVFSEVGIVQRLPLNAFLPQVGDGPLAVVGPKERLSGTKASDAKLSAVASAVAVRWAKLTTQGETFAYLPASLTVEALDFSVKPGKWPPGFFWVSDEKHTAAVPSASLGLTPNDPGAAEQQVRTYQSARLEMSPLAAERSEVARRINYGKAATKVAAKGLPALLDFLLNVEFVYATWDNAKSLKDLISVAKKRLAARPDREPAQVHVLTNEWMRLQESQKCEVGILTIPNNPRVEVW